MEDGNVFFYAALVVIAFISWVVGRIREAVQAFRERQDYKDRPVRTDIGPPTSTASPPPPPQVPQRDRAREAMRETYRALGIPFPDDEAPAPAPPKPKRPPARQNKKVVAAGTAQLTADERKALNRLKQRQNANIAGSSGSGETGKSGTSGANVLRRLLRNRNATRQAILLKEILDKPKSLRTDTV